MNEKISNEEFIEVYNNKIDYPTLNDIANYFNKSYDYVRGKVESLRRQNKYDIISRKPTANNTSAQEDVDYNSVVEDLLSPDKKTIKKQNEEIKILRQQINDLTDKIHGSSDIEELIYGVKNEGFHIEPEWLTTQTPNKSDELVPVLFLTDIHIGEVVSSADMGFTEDYNTNIAIKSANKVVEDFINICTVKMSNYSYPGVVLMLGGDGITGSLHDLAETNDSTPIKQIRDLTSLYIQQIKKLEDKFGNVAVFAVTGNHGRLDAHGYTKTKKRTENSLETLVYYFVGEYFKDNKNVNIITDESDEIYFKINSRKFLLTHGDRGIKGGGGIGGIVVPIKRAKAKMLQNAVAMGKDFQTLVIGHFHQHFVTEDCIIGNSLKPFDEYSKSMGFEYSPAGATSFFVNKHGDIIYVTHIKVRSENKVKEIRKKSIELF